MPKYYFNLKGSGELIESDTPIQFACLATAKADALVDYPRHARRPAW